MGKRIRHRLRLLRLLRRIPSFRSFFLIVAVVTAVTLAFVGGETGDPVFLALAPSMGSASAPHPGATYPAGTRLARVSPENPEESLQVIPAWTLASPAAISYDGRRVLFAGTKEGDPFDQIWELRRDVGSPRRVIGQDAHCATPFYLPNGRIVFNMEVEAEPNPVHSLFTCALDGTDLDRITYGRSVDRVISILQDGRVLFERSLWREGSKTEQRDVLAVFPDGSGLARYSGPFPESPPLPSWAELHLQPARGWSGKDPSEADASSGLSGQPIDRLDGFQVFDPAPAAPGTRPRVATSMVDRSRSSGWLLCLDAYRSRLPNLSEADPGSLRKVRVWDSRADTLLGEAPIEQDGSFFLEVPADRLLRLELTDSQGAVVAALENGIWVRPNEHRGCIGCHEPSHLAVENRAPLALRKPPNPVGVIPSHLYAVEDRGDPYHE